MTFESDRTMAVAEARKHIDDELTREIAALRAALKQCWIIAHDRSIVCQAAAKRYEKSHPDEPYWAASERCAHREADLIAREIRALDAPPEGEG